MVKNMSKLCLGTWQFESQFGKVTLEEAKEIVQYARSKGIKYIDTAQVYEKQRIERMLADIIEDSDIIITKIPACEKPQLYSNCDINKYYALEWLEERIEISKKNLKRIPDIILLHNWIPFWNDKDISQRLIMRLVELRKTEKVQKIGISLPDNFNRDIPIWILKEIDFLEAPYNRKNNWILGIIENVKKYDVKLGLRSLFERGSVLQSELNKKDIYNHIKRAGEIADVLIIGMTSKENIDNNILLMEEKMDQKLKNLLVRTISKEQIKYIMENYNDICNDEILGIGIDSFDYMNLLSELEDICKGSEDIPDTLKDIEDFLHKYQ